MTPQIHPKRKRGGQPGNTNALKHGYYAQKLPPADRADLESHRLTGVSEEAEILRVYIRRVVELTTQTENLPLDQAVRLLRILSLSVTSLSHILRTDQILFRNRITTHDLAFARRIELIRAHEDAREDARLAARLGLDPGGQPEPDPAAQALPAAETPASADEDAGADMAGTAEEAVRQLSAFVDILDRRYPELTALDRF